MRNPHLMVKILKGASIHPHLKYYSGKKIFGSALQNLASQFENLNIDNGRSIKSYEKKIRKPLKFLF